MKIAMLMTEIHRNEVALVHDLLALAGSHRDSHEVHHVAKDLTRWSARHVARLAEVGRDHGAQLDAQVPEPPEAGSATAQASSLELLEDLRGVYMSAAGISAQWVMLGQAAQALHLDDLLELIGECHPGTLRQMRWAATALKQESTQILVS